VGRVPRLTVPYVESLDDLGVVSGSASERFLLDHVVAHESIDRTLVASFSS
jgi:hypothetical protein